MTSLAESVPIYSERANLKLAFASIGVIFGDIGTSPLYAMREALSSVVADHAANLRDSVLGVASSRSATTRSSSHRRNTTFCASSCSMPAKS